MANSFWQVMPGTGKCAEFGENGCKFLLISSLRALILQNYAGEVNVRKQEQMAGETRILSYLNSHFEKNRVFSRSSGQWILT
jgi:hypothetical protein